MILPVESERTFPWKRVFLCLLVPALSLRLLQLFWAAGDPLVRFPFEDGLSYSKWALEIAGGDWAGTQRPVFYQAPLYPYVLAVMHGLGLGMFPWPQLFHALVGTLTVLFVFLTTERLVSRRAAWVAGGAMAVWGPALMYELVIDKVTLGLCATAAAAWLLLRLHDRAQAGDGGLRRHCVAVGLALGCAAMLRENFLVLVPIAAGFVWIRTRRLVHPAGLVGGCLLGLLPVLLHNGLVGGEWLPTTYQGGSNFWIGNHDGAEGTYEPLLPGRGDPAFEESDAVALASVALGEDPADVSRGAVNRYWFGEGLAYAGSDPIGWFGLQLRKLQWFVFHAEAPDSIAYDGFRASAPWLLPSRLLFGLAFPLALLGVFLLGRMANARFFAMLAITACSSVVLFYVVSRYRLACVPFLLPFAAAAAVEIARRPVLVAWLVGLMIPSQAWLATRAPSGLESDAQQAVLWVNRGTALGTFTKDVAAAASAYEKALALQPELVAAHRSLSRLLMAPPKPQFERALRHCRACVKLAPIDMEARHNLGFCLLRLGKLQESERQLRLVLERSRKVPLVTVRQLAKCLQQQGRNAEAAELLAANGAAPGG